MSAKALFFAAVLASVEARFGQENVPSAAIAALGSRGQPGQAATLSGQVPGVLLAAASACKKLELADTIVAQLGNTDDVIAATRGLVAAEMNFNPFAVKVNKICDDASLPKTEALRGVLPLVDPSVVGADVQNANSKQSLTNPFDATGISVAALSIAKGFSNFTLGDTGTAAAGGAAGGAAGNNGGNPNNNAGNPNNAGNQNNNAGNKGCNGGKQNNAGNNNAGADNNNNNAGNGNAGAGNAGALDFGTCVPTIEFALGRPGRKADQGTFLPVDPAILKGQSDALNPSIIMNRVCDQLNSRTCNANKAAIDKCLAAKKQVEAAGTKDATTATLFNSLVQ
ncbi:hypothetical protein RB594_001475 [Gaeumannomyces avenae]